MSSRSRSASARREKYREIMKNPMVWFFVLVIAVGFFFLFSYIVQVSLDYVIPDIQGAIYRDYDKDTYQAMSYWSGVLILVVALIIGMFFKSDTVVYVAKDYM